MNENEKARRAVLSILRAFKQYQVKALSQNTVLAGIIKLSPKEKSALTTEKIQAAIEKAEEQASQLVAHESASLEKALSSDTDFLPALEIYVGQALGFVEHEL